jgi:hypothetical protein
MYVGLGPAVSGFAINDIGVFSQPLLPGAKTNLTFGFFTTLIGIELDRPAANWAHLLCLVTTTEMKSPSNNPVTEKTESIASSFAVSFLLHKIVYPVPALIRESILYVIVSFGQYTGRIGGT